MNPFVTDAHVADLLLLPHGDEVHAVPRERVSWSTSRAAIRRADCFVWTGHRAPRRGGAGEEARRLLAAALDRAALACAAQQLGIGQQMIDMAVRYATEREQFGKPIGSFQAIKHMLANVAVRLEFARPVVYRAAFSVAHDSAATRPSTCRTRSSPRRRPPRWRRRRRMQVHGAIGYTWESDLQIWMKRAWALDMAWGTGAWHRARVAGAVLDGAASGNLWILCAEMRAE